MGGQIALDDLIRFWMFVDKKDEESCWNWRKQGKRLYGNFSFGKTNCLAHRLSYFIHFGEFDLNLNVLHRCNNTHCVNPKHLYLGTQLENRKQAIEDKRTAIKTDHGMSKLTYYEVLYIRDLAKEGISYADLAKQFKVSPSTIRSIVLNKTWK